MNNLPTPTSPNDEASLTSSDDATKYLAVEINGEHALAMQHAGAAVSHGIKVGQLLLQAKETIAHGQWLPWLRANVLFSERTAQSYMRIAHKSPPEIRNGAADLSLRKALQHVAGPRRLSLDEELAGLGKRTAERERRKPADHSDTLYIKLISANLHDFEITFHRLGICPGEEVVGFCSVCDAERAGTATERLTEMREWLERFEETMATAGQDGGAA